MPGSVSEWAGELTVGGEPRGCIVKKADVKGCEDGVVVVLGLGGEVL